MIERNWSVMKKRFDRGELVRNQHTFPRMALPVHYGRGARALAAESQASAEAKAMPKAGRLALAAEKAAKPKNIPTQPPPRRRIRVMTLGVQLRLRWFMGGQRITAGEDVQRLNRRAKQHGKGDGRGPAIDKGDVESTAAAM